MTAGGPFRIATYNVHGCIGVDGRFDLARTAGVIAGLDADVVLLQEVGDHVKRQPTVNQAHDLAEACAMTYAVGYTMPTGPWGYGNVVLTRRPIAGVHRFDLSVARREPRGCLRVDVRVGDGLVSVIALHLGLRFRERRVQIATLLGERGALDGLDGGPVVVGGDFNDFPPGACRALQRCFVDAGLAARDRRPTFPSRLPIIRLDRIYARGPLSLSGYEVIRSREARQASDHLPVVAEYHLGSEPFAAPNDAKESG
jgi:endonuclease/exonuclease/phosphatase family metal-dependent hydrolase